MTVTLALMSVVVLGAFVRAYERRADLRAYNRRLLDYVDRGGTVKTQVTRPTAAARQVGLEPQDCEAVLGTGEACVEGKPPAFDARCGVDAGRPTRGARLRPGGAG